MRSRTSLPHCSLELLVFERTNARGTPKKVWNVRMSSLCHCQGVSWVGYRGPVRIRFFTTSCHDWWCPCGGHRFANTASRFFPKGSSVLMSPSLRVDNSFGTCLICRPSQNFVCLPFEQPGCAVPQNTTCSPVPISLINVSQC